MMITICLRLQLPFESFNHYQSLKLCLLSWLELEIELVDEKSCLNFQLTFLTSDMKERVIVNA